MNSLLIVITLSASLQFLTELFFRATITLRLWSVHPLGHGFTAWVQSWSPEEHPKALILSSVCCWSSQDWYTQQTVSSGAFCKAVSNVYSFRFTQIAPFSLSTICHFLPDVADMSQRLAWFFKNVLQVSNWLLAGWQYLTCCVPVCYPCLWRPFPSSPWLKHPDPSIPTLQMAHISQALNAHKQFPCAPSAIPMAPWWPAASFPMMHMQRISYPQTTQGSSTTAEEGNGWACHWPLKERTIISLTPEDV